MVTEVIRLAEGGRIVIPVKLRQELGLKPGDELIIHSNDGEITIMTREQAWKKARDYVRSITPPGVSLADELIRERREETGSKERELEEWLKAHRDPVRP